MSSIKSQDDHGIDMIGETCTKLKELNVGRTWITNHGLEKLSISPDWSVVREEVHFVCDDGCKDQEAYNS